MQAQPCTRHREVQDSKGRLGAGREGRVRLLRPAYDGMTGAQAGALVKFSGADQATVTALSFNTAHNNEHYGAIVTYLRLKGLVPPSSEKRQ